MANQNHPFYRISFKSLIHNREIGEVYWHWYGITMQLKSYPNVTAVAKHHAAFQGELIYPVLPYHLRQHRRTTARGMSREPHPKGALHFLRSTSFAARDGTARKHSLI